MKGGEEEHVDMEKQEDWMEVFLLGPGQVRITAPPL